jgi:hypothetical protein
MLIMKAHEQNQTPLDSRSNPAHSWLASCRKLLAQIEKVKASILSDFRDQLDQDEHLLHLAVNEAEAVAWQTGFPQLVFPTLATEKARAVATWQERQRSIHRTNAHTALAA